MTEDKESKLTEKEREQQFMIGLTELTRKTGMIIAGCGCCGSPYINRIVEEDLLDEQAGYGYGYTGEVSWISPSDKYDWENYSDSIVKEK